MVFREKEIERVGELKFGILCCNKGERERCVLSEVLRGQQIVFLFFSSVGQDNNCEALGPFSLHCGGRLLDLHLNIYPA